MSLKSEINGPTRGAQPQKVGTSIKGGDVAHLVPKGGDVRFRGKGGDVATGGDVKKGGDVNRRPHLFFRPQLRIC